MGTWRADQSKGGRRYVWGETRGETDDTRRDFIARLKAFVIFNGLRTEKIGSEMHLWRLEKIGTAKPYWTSCLRFVDDGWGYWTVYYRPDERRWRSAPAKELPLGKAMTLTAEFYKQTFETMV